MSFFIGATPPKKNLDLPLLLFFSILNWKLWEGLSFEHIYALTVQHLALKDCHFCVHLFDIYLKEHVILYAIKISEITRRYNY